MSGSRVVAVVVVVAAAVIVIVVGSLYIPEIAKSTRHKLARKLNTGDNKSETSSPVAVEVES